jgi:hypothetical protein
MPDVIEPGTAWATLIAKRWDISGDHAMQVANTVRVAYERLKAGGSDEDYDLVASALNVAVVRAEMIGAGPLLDAINAKKCGRGAALGAMLLLAMQVHETMDKARVLMGTIRLGMQALLEADARRQTHGSYGFDGPGIQAMNDAIGAYEDIMGASTGLQMEAATSEVYRRERAQRVAE